MPFEYNGVLKTFESPLMVKLIESVKKGERSEFTINAGYLNGTQDDEETLEDNKLIELFPIWDKSKDLFIRMEVTYIVKIEDWFKDGSTMVRTLRKGGKGRNPYCDSTVKLRMKIQVDDEIKYDNYSENAVAKESDNLKPLTREERLALLEDPTLYKIKLDEYNLPSLLIKLIKSMKKNGVTEMTTTCL